MAVLIGRGRSSLKPHPETLDQPVQALIPQHQAFQRVTSRVPVFKHIYTNTSTHKHVQVCVRTHTYTEKAREQELQRQR